MKDLINEVDIEKICIDISTELSISKTSVLSTVNLITEGATIPFIARYRKEKTGGLDELQIKNIKNKMTFYIELDKRKILILKTIEEQDKLTPFLKNQIIACKDKQKLEDIYLPYKPKRKTRATVAESKGLKPLADLIYAQKNLNQTREDILKQFINKEKDVNTIQEALCGASDIIAEKISESSEIRGDLRKYIEENGLLVSSVKKGWKDKKSKYEMYYNFKEILKNITSHRILAIRRACKENIITWKINIDETKALSIISNKTIKNPKFIFYDDIIKSIHDSYKRLLKPSLDIEVFNNKIADGEKEAINVFAKNLRKLFLAPPVGRKIIMGIDPGFRTGSKVVVLDEFGNFKEHETIYPNPPQNESAVAEKIIVNLIKKHTVEIIAIGNGTASRETETFIKNTLQKFDLKTMCVVVSETGASVYSASDVAIKEFPYLDITIRGAISIARRLQDPLAELVKIDPKAIGVGQYQHDVNQIQLKNMLDFEVASCVNYVGVDVNTASKELLSYVSGIGGVIAQNIINYRIKNGAFKSRQEFLNISLLGAKAFEQCAGFLRIKGAKNILDNSSIHPESYYIVKQIAEDLGISIENLIGNITEINKIVIEKYVTDSIGLLTLNDICDQLKKPGLDPRDEFVMVKFDDTINEITDLNIGQKLQGKVTNVTNFGAFVDIGVHQDGLIHISELSNKFIKDPHDIISVGNIVEVKILNIDIELKRISLSKTH